MKRLPFDLAGVNGIPQESQHADFLRQPDIDPEFLHDFSEGKEAGLSKLYKLYHLPLIRCGLQIVQDYFAVENIVQDAFLKVWLFRDRLKSYLHAYRFMRMNVKWDCYDYYKKPENRLVVYAEYEAYPAVGNQPLADYEEDIHKDEEMLQAIYKVIPYLPADRQTVLQLYFKYGFSYKQIAKRYSSSVQNVTREIYEGLDYLKKVIHASKQVIVSAPITMVRKEAEECLTGEMLQLFRLRYECKLPFDIIATKMNLSQSYVQQQYVIAHRQLNQLKKSRRHG